MVRRFLLLFLIGIFGYSAYLSTLNESKIPPLHDADLIFQTSWTDQSIAIGLATGSLYIHAGIIRETEYGPVVIEAAQTVRETPLHQWIDRGILKRFALYRYKGLAPEQAAKVLAAAKIYYGRPYDHYFSLENDEIYCSELIYLAYKDAQVPAAPPERIGTLYINNPFTKKLIEQRWHNYPACKGKDFTFDQCYDIIMGQDIITPARIASDSHFERIFTNYP